MNKVVASTILVIGDNTDFRYLMQRYVRKSAYQIAFADPDEGALALARRARPTAIILEADLPGAAGWDMLRALKADLATCDIPVAVCSWLDEEERSFEEGADAYLHKPILYADFVAALAAMDIIPR